VIGRRFSFRCASCSLSLFLLLSFLFVPFQVLRFVYSFWSHEIGNNLYSDGRSFSPEKIFHDIFRTQLVCLTLWQREPFIGMVLPITNCAQGMLDVVCLGVTYDDMPDQSVLLVLLLTFAIFMWLFRYACSF
jgi:hypothetical protein